MLARYVRETTQLQALSAVGVEAKPIPNRELEISRCHPSSRPAPRNPQARKREVPSRTVR
jgi:hypothetical protein